MNIKPFAIERFFAAHEFATRIVLGASDCESIGMTKLLSFADPETRKLWDELKLGYTEGRGHPLLREEIAALYETLPSREIMVLTPEEGIFVLMNAVLTRGDHALVITPSYQSLSEVARSIGVEVTAWPLTRNGSEWKLDVDFLRDAMRKETRLLVLNFPNNPTGHHITRSELDDILGIADAHGTIVFSDEMYRFGEFRDTDRLPSVCDLYENSVVLGGLSKVFSLPGLRIGWLASRRADIMAACEIVRDYTTICNSAPGEILATIGLRSRERLLSRSARIIRQNLDIATRFFQKHLGKVEWIPPRAGPVAFPRLLTGEPTNQFCQRLIAERSVTLVPGAVFQFHGEHFRIGLGRNNFSDGLDELGKFLEK